MSMPSLPSAEVREFPARFAAVTGTADFALSFCERNGISRQVASRLRLIIEELFTNSIQHGYRVESDTPIRIELAVIEGHPVLKYEDSAPPYDLVNQVSALASRDVAPLDAPPVDGLGIFLIGKLAYGAHHVYEDGRNRLWLVLPAVDAARRDAASA
jgi:serine/threonine-protein kinase RsbW